MLYTFTKFVQYLPIFLFANVYYDLPLFVCLQCKLKLQVQSKHIRIIKKKKARTKLAYLKAERERERERGQLTN